MQCPDCAHPHYILYGTSRGVQRYRCQAYQRLFQTIRPGKDPAFKQQACQLYPEGMRIQTKSPLGADHAPPNDRLCHGIAEVLRECHYKRQALRSEALHQTN